MKFSKQERDNFKELGMSDAQLNSIEQRDDTRQAARAAQRAQLLAEEKMRALLHPEQTTSGPDEVKTYTPGPIIQGLTLSTKIKA